MFIRDFIDILAFHVHIHGTLAALSSHARHSLHLGIAVIILIGMGLIHVFNEFPFEFNYKESIGIQEYLKLLGLKISNNKGKIIDTVFSLIDVVEYLSVAKLLVFVNLKLYLSDDELNEIYKYAMYKKVNILLIETGEEKEPIKNEKILFVDSDYDEIILYNK